MRDLIIDVLEETGWTWEWLGGRLIVHDGRDGVFELIPLDAAERLWIAYVTDGRGHAVTRTLRSRDRAAVRRLIGGLAGRDA